MVRSREGVALLERALALHRAAHPHDSYLATIEGTLAEVRGELRR